MKKQDKKQTPSETAPEAAPEKTAPRPAEAFPASAAPDPNIVQRQASDPAVSAWVTASAGTGKTKVLTDRVLRLMLTGTEPDQILALTFTRAGSAVMTIRIRDELAAWEGMTDHSLKKRLEKLTGAPPDAETTKRARGLFTKFLDSHGGLRMQTIHSFAQDLIRRFPIESGVPPYFDVMDDQTAADLLRESQAAVLRKVHEQPDTPLARAVKMVTPEVAEDDFVALMNELTSRRGQLFSIIEKHGGLEGTVDAVYDYLNAPRGIDSRTMTERFNSDKGLEGLEPDLEALNHAADALARGMPTDQEKAKVMKAWLTNPEDRAELFWEYTGAFLTREGEPRKRMTTKGVSHVQHVMEAEAERLVEGIDRIATMNLARGTESILRLTSAILEEYDQRKRALNLLDYDDLIHRANKMMKEDNAGGWVLQKLPGDIRHVLIDEGQDTNPDQWQLVTAVVHEFFTNPARIRQKGHTVFVVGDEKQSIFSFQRADPKEFAAHKKRFASLVKQSGGTWREVEMQTTFRSSPAITEAVDAVFANPEASDGLFSDGAEGEPGRKVKHSPFRQGQAGVVEVHPVLAPVKTPDPEPWTLPLAREDAPRPAAELAERIADTIGGWLESGEKLEARDRAISPADIMILVRRRSEFVDYMVRALKKRDIPVAGADRLSLSDQIAVMDLTALGEVLLFPKDDYKLASVLKSPLIGMNDQELEDLAVGRKGDLWTALAEKAAEENAPAVYREAHKYLSNLQQDLNTERPYEFYSSVLMNACPVSSSGLSAFYGRLGFEAEDPLVEFLNAVERFEKNHVPSLQGFLSWLSAGEAEIKREINLDPDQPRVHIMTVHGAKGLEAPIVILPDTTGIPEDNARTRPRFLWPEGERALPLWAPRADLENRLFRSERAKTEQERDREYRRLMYVAMTRAADRLYVYGHTQGSDPSEKSWYSLITKGLIENLGDKLEVLPAPPLAGTEPKQPQAPEAVKDISAKEAAEDALPSILRFHAPQTARPVPDGMKPLDRPRRGLIPSWARKKPAGHYAPLGRFTPSEYKISNDNLSAPSPLAEENANRARKIGAGTAVHSLFEFLPTLPMEEREDTARKYLARPAWNLSEEEREKTVKNVMTVMNDPQFGAIFGPNSRPEVSISGIVDHGGRREIMNAQIDRLVVEKDSVLIIDYKHTTHVPEDAAHVKEAYRAQMAAYRLAVQSIYPGRQVKTALLYTQEAKLIPLPDKMLDEALKAMDLKAAPPAPKPGRKPQSVFP